ncbi:MAG TPA: DUF6603 domain-containing protein, partial [Blastocatellia bacterium]|nr:DUF6603 domain-containing protein [Blastocatellia bacterium]
SICAGIALTRANGSSVGVDKEKKELAGVRFNFRIPFTPKMRDEQKDFATDFAPPVIKAQKRLMKDESAWEDFKDWKEFVERFCASAEGGELLNAPVGPLLLETISDSSGVKDIVLNKKKRDEIKEESAEVKKELKDALELLKNLWEVKKGPKPEQVIPNSSTRRLGGLLDSLGILEGKGAGAGNYKYTLKNLSQLTVWDVLDGAVAELDGFPLYIKGVDPEDDNGTRMAFTLASKIDETDPKKQYMGLAGLAYNIPIEEPSKKGGDDDAVEVVLDNGDSEEEDEPENRAEMRLHLGKWFDGETLDDNWFRRLLPAQGSDKSAWKRRVPLPGIRLLPLKRVQQTENNRAAYSLELRGDLLSIGFDIKSTGKEGLTFLKAKNGPFAYFGLGAVEVRLALLLSPDRVAIGGGVKLKNLRLSLGPKEPDEDEDDILGALKHLFGEDEAEEEEPPLKTRLGGKKIDKFSISVGYLSPLTTGSSGTLDIQLYDKKGNRGKMVWIPIDRQPGTVYLKQLGIGLKDVENVELSKGLSDSAQLTVALTGGFRWPVFEMGFIGAKLIFPLKNPGNLSFGLDGLDLSLKIGSVVISGSFLRSGLEYAGSLTVDLPKVSFGAMGYYGNLTVFSKAFANEVIDDLRDGKLHAKFIEELDKNGIKPDSSKGVKQVFWSEWEFFTRSGVRLTIVDHEGKLHVQSPEKSLFIYGVLSTESGNGIKAGPIEFTAVALGLGIHRRIVIPPIEKVAEFPLVKMVMGKGGYQDKEESGDIQKQLGKANDNPVEVLEKMKDWLPAEANQYFICAGVRFTIAMTVDCFALLIAQFGNDFEVTLMGLARFRKPSDTDKKAICYVEMQVLMSLKPSEGSFKLQALLTSNSWIINKDCKLTGGFALFVWFGGPHKDDFVITLGGYHPRFKRPDHYPIVPRLGLNWPVSDTLSIKGGIYLAVTPSCCMLGGRLEASFSSGRVSAWFTAYLDAILEWSPLHFEVELGVSMRIEAAFFLLTIKLALSASIEMWGPPVGGIAHVNLTLISFDLPFDFKFGTQREEAKPKLIDSWAQFCRSFLSATEESRPLIDAPVTALPITQPSLAAGLNNLNNLPSQNGQSAPSEETGDDRAWIVRGDELELAASASVPLTVLNLGRAKPDSLPEGTLESELIGKPLMVANELVFEPKGLRARQAGNAIGVRPMGKGLQSVLNVTVVFDDASVAEPLDVSEWSIEEEKSALPAALWEASAPNPNGPSEPTAKLIPDCITGIKRLKPPTGRRGKLAEYSQMTWHQLETKTVARPGAAQAIPTKTRPRSVQTAMASKQAALKGIADALSEVGFDLEWKPGQAEIRFRELQAEPLTYAG